eukprot:258150_1
MAHAATLKRLMQNLRSINNDMEKFECSSHRVNQIIESEPQNHLVFTYLQDERVKLQSIANDPSKSYHHSMMGTLKPSRTPRSKLNFSSKKKPRPTKKRTPLKVSTATVSNLQNITHKSNDTIVPNPPNPLPPPSIVFAHNTYNKTIPQKTALLSISKQSQKMNICDTDSDNDENMAPNNLLGGAAKSLVQMKLEQQNRKKQIKKKPKVDALQKAKEKRLQDEQKERERAKQRERQRAQIAENKENKRKAAEKQQRLKHQSHHKTHHKPKKHMTHKKMKNAKKMPSMKKKTFKIQQPVQGETQYEVSDYDSNFSDSDLDEETCGKFIPVWARKKAPVQSFARQNAMDPDTIFGRMYYKTVDLEVLFKDYPSRSKYRNRSQSGDWSKDQTSWAEENAYKKSMGWCK